MLGRLRMSIDDGIEEYWRLSNSIFRPRRFVFPFSSKKLEEAVIKVVHQCCHCHHKGNACDGRKEEFRQYDYAEEGEPAGRYRLNQSCKV